MTRLAALIVCLVPLVIASCGVLQQLPIPIVAAESKSEARELELRAHVKGFASLATATVRDASNEIVEQSEDPALRELAVLWKIRTFEIVRDAAHRRVASEACLDIWAMAYQMAAFFRSGDGAEMFGALHPIAQKAAESLEQEIDRVIGKVLAADEAARAKQHVREFADRLPMQASFARTPLEVARADTSGVFVWMNDFTLNPFSSGLSEGADAIEEASYAAERFTDVVADFPELTRWQSQLLLLDLQRNGAVKQAMAQLERFATASDELIATVQGLPTSIRTEVASVLADVDARQVGLRDTLQAAEVTAAGLTGLSESIHQTAGEVTAMASVLDTTFRTFDGTVAQLVGSGEADSDSPAPAGGEPRRPFDILEYEKTARAIAAMSADLRETLDEFHGLLADEAIDERVLRVESAADHAVNQLSSQLLRTGLILLGALLAVLLAYRFVVMRYFGRLA